MKQRSTQFSLIVFAAILGMCVPATATIPYSNPGPFVSALGPGLPTPPMVPGKEFSHDSDITALPPGGGLDPAQVLAWDGFGGTADGLDYSSPPPSFATDGTFQVDAIAHRRDLLLQQLLEDVVPLVFSVDDMATTTIASGLMPVMVPSVGPLMTSGGNSIGGAGEISYEIAGAPIQATWATAPMVNGMPLPNDVDGLEVWGPEPMSAPNFDASAFGDADKYSVDTDITTGIAAPAASVINYPAQTPYVSHAQVYSLVSSLLGPDGGLIDEPLVNLDALMVNDVNGDPDRFDPGDTIIFSIEQVASTAASDGSGFLATGSEIFVMDGSSTPAVPVGTFLAHGGHLWDKAFGLTSMTATLMTPAGVVDVQLDVNAIEAIGIPEPAGGSVWLLLAILVWRRRH